MTKTGDPTTKPQRHRVVAYHGRGLSLATLEEDAVKVLADVGNPKARKRAAEAITRGLATFTKIIKAAPAQESAVLLGAYELIYALANSVGREALVRHKRGKGLKEVNEKKAEVKARAAALATEKWQADTHEQIRIGAMADEVYRALLGEGYKLKDMPDSKEGVKPWIKDVAPSYARSGGRPRKTP